MTFMSCKPFFSTQTKALDQLDYVVKKLRAKLEQHEFGIALALDRELYERTALVMLGGEGT